MKMRRKGLRIILFFGVVLLVLFLVNKKPRVSNEDATYIDSFLKEWQLTTTPENVHQSFENELSFISTVHDRVTEQIKHEQVDIKNFGEVKNYYSNRKGFCYDRVVLLEKILDEFGFDYRHVYVWYAPNFQKTSFFDIFKARTLSHAVVEVKTAKGWMILDGNEKWRSIDVNGKLYTMADLARLHREKKEINVASPFPKSPLSSVTNFYYLYGVYSRHGKFLSPRLGIPDVNLRMLLYNL